MSYLNPIGMERTGKKRGSFKLPRSKGANSAAKRFGSDDEVFLGRKTPKPARPPIKPRKPSIGAGVYAYGRSRGKSGKKGK